VLGRSSEQLPSTEWKRLAVTQKTPFQILLRGPWCVLPHCCAMDGNSMADEAKACDSSCEWTDFWSRLDETEELCHKVAAFRRGPHAEQLLAALHDCEGSPGTERANAHAKAYGQCVSAAFCKKYPPQSIVDTAAAAVDGEFHVVHVAVSAVVNAEDTPEIRPYFLGHPMLQYGPATLPRFIEGFITDNCKEGSDLHDRKGEVSRLFAMHGAVLAVTTEKTLRKALARSLNLAPNAPMIKKFVKELIGHKGSVDLSVCATWNPLKDLIREKLPAQLSTSTVPNLITAADLAAVLKVMGKQATPKFMQTYVKQVKEGELEDEAKSPPPFDNHCCDSDDEAQQDRGVEWLLQAACDQTKTWDKIKNSCHSAILTLISSRKRKPSERTAREFIQATIHPYEQTAQIKPDFVRWLRYSKDHSIRLPTMVGESKTKRADPDRAKYELAVYLMFLVRLFRLVDPKPAAVGRLWHGKRLQYYTMELCTKEGGTRGYALTPWGDSFDMSTDAGRSGAVQRERACLKYCECMEEKVGHIQVMIVAMNRRQTAK